MNPPPSTTTNPASLFTHSDKNIKLREEALEEANYKLGQGSNNLNRECSISGEIFNNLPLTRFCGGRYHFL